MVKPQTDEFGLERAMAPSVLFQVREATPLDVRSWLVSWKSV